MTTSGTLGKKVKNKAEKWGSLFEWPVATDYIFVSGYQFDPEFSVPFEPEIGIDDQPPWLMDFGIPNPTFPLQDEPALHRKFGGLNPTEKSIIKFVRKHGLLGIYIPLYQDVKVRKGQIARSHETGESLKRWDREICDMALCLDIWELVKAENAGKLHDIIKWPNAQKVILQAGLKLDRGVYKVHPLKEGDASRGLIRSIASVPVEKFKKTKSEVESERYKWEEYMRKLRNSSDTDRGLIQFYESHRSQSNFNAEIQLDELERRHHQDLALLKRWKIGDVIEPARDILGVLINEKLRQQVFVQLGWLDFKNMEPYTTPRSLLSAMWLLFMWEVIGADENFKCPGCGEWYLREDPRQKTCSDKCRKRKQRLQFPD